MLLLMAILLALLMQNVACKSIGNYPVQEGVDLIWVKKGQTVVAPTDGAFLSTAFYKEQFDRCSQ